MLGVEHLAERARELARGHTVLADSRPRLSARLLARLQSTGRVLEIAHDRLVVANASGTDISQAGVWLLDNYHVVREQILETRTSLPRGYYRELPELSSGPLAGYPRVYGIVISLISHTEARVDPQNTEQFIEAYQSLRPLTIGELWAIPAMLRLGLIESVRRMAMRTVQRLDELAEADKWAERMHGAGEASAEDLHDALGSLQENNPRLTPAFVSRFLRQVRAAAGAFPPLEWLQAWTQREGLSAEEAVVASTHQLALTQLMMANSITSLRAIGGRDWREFVERQSLLDRALRADPAHVYDQMTFTTRDRYRHVVERIAKRTGNDEVWVAEWAVELAKLSLKRESEDQRQGHVGFYLVDAGIAELERKSKYETTIGEALYRYIRRHPTRVFVGAMTLATIGAIVAVLKLGGTNANMAWFLIVAVTLIPANDIAVSLINQLVTAFLPTHVLPRLNFEEKGIATDCPTAVVVPTLFDSAGDVRDTLAHLEVQFLANRDDELHFTVLSDFTDAPAEQMPGDEEIVQQALQGIRELNAKYAKHGDVFHLLHRARHWNASEGVWMGWERKRGKLAQFNKLTQGGGSMAFAYTSAEVNAMDGTRYVITLDSDTVLPANAARALVGTIAHPLHHAVYDEGKGRIVRGYGILQPRVGVSLPSANRSHFASIMSGVPGVDPYTTAVSDVYQDLFHEGSFTGKGIYDVQAFERATSARFPENTLLSHDLIEGNYARAGLVTDIVVYDDYPARYLTATRRKHRWIRGDWQLLPWLSRKVPGPDGPEKNRLSLLSQWKILDNMRRSVVEVAQLAFLLAGWTLLPGSPIRWTILACAAIGAPWVISTLITLVRPPNDKSWRSYYRAAGEDALASAKQFALAVIFLPHQAWTAMDAIARALYRLTVSRKHLLEWKSAQKTERAHSNDSRALWRDVRTPVVGIVCISLMIVVFDVWSRLHLAEVVRWNGAFDLYAAVGGITALWVASPRIARVLSAPIRSTSYVLSPNAREDALRYARLHWKYFEKFATGDTHWLTPDNYQVDPAPVIAMRTSPTNIGLQLMSTISAYDLGFIDVTPMTELLQKTFQTLENLPKYQGHFYNWYDLHDLRVLEPAYISTVDSGNLAGHLIAVRQACLEIAGQLRSASDAAGANANANANENDIANQLTELAKCAGDIVAHMDFSFLFDNERKLFAIGYHVASHSQDSSRYDLLASEARLTSFLAIARNQVPVEHWFMLGRNLTRTEGATALVSWTGTMFEYLMPLLVMRSFRSTVLSATYRAAIQRQIAYAERRNVPWGISESAYNMRDREYTYQYRAFGIPDLALKRDMHRDLVVAPYATALAAMVDPTRAIENLRALESMGVLGEYGFYDALDYTRPASNKRYATVKTFMAHHLGMTMVALTNVLLDNRWQRRFHGDAVVRSAELLLHERIPRRLVLYEPQAEPPIIERGTEPIEQPVAREFTSPNTIAPQVALLGYQPYTVMLTQSGSGYSRFNGLAVTRWKADATLENTGQFCYVQDVSRKRHWSAAHQPTCVPADSYSAVLATDRVTISRSDGDIDTKVEIAAIPADAAEVRRVTVYNRSHSVREIQLTSYGEIVLAPPEADSAHPAFSNLFVETEWHAWCNAITATRRPRNMNETPVWCVHVAATGAELVGDVSYETDRAQFLGRGRNVRNPSALDVGSELSKTTGAVLDPIFSLRTRIRVPAGQSACVSFTTLVAATRERAFELADRYRDERAAERALDLAWTSTQIELAELGISPTDAAVFQELAGHMYFAGEALGASRAVKERNRGSQSTLWSIGISGDLPILQATISSDDGLPMLRQLFAAHRYWRRRGLMVDLVVLNTQEHGYLEELNSRINEAMLSAIEAEHAEKPGGIFVRRTANVPDDAALMLAASARALIECDERNLADVVSNAREVATVPMAITPIVNIAIADGVPRKHLPVALASSAEGTGADASVPLNGGFAPLSFDNGYGGLDEANNYHVQVANRKLPPAPWANVIANANGGFLVSERGAGCVWAESSYFYRITAWQNDPVSDPVTDVIYMRDDDSRALWSATPAPIATSDTFQIVHGAGFSTFEHTHDEIVSQLTLGVPSKGATKISLLRLTNASNRIRRLTLTPYAEWTLGVRRELTRHAVRTWFDSEHSAVFAQNRYELGFADRVSFLSVSEPVTSHTASRAEFIGRNGSLNNPLAFRSNELNGAVGVGLDPCAALQCSISLAPGESREVAVLLGSAENEEAARARLSELRAADKASAAIATSRQEWDDRLSVVSVKTPDRAFDAIVNKWSLYQALSGRMWARMGLYQSSGAYGFRDQLQDVMAFLYAEPQIAREHILRAARRQFLEGDVQHWWHPHTGRGVRTKFSDDLVWLPYVVDQYVRVTGDRSILDEYVPFLKMRTLGPNEHELYDLPDVTDEQGSIYEHCLRALVRACTVGAHGLPLIGSGDWNDGFSRVGIEGKGESVWLAWFLLDTLRNFSVHAEAHGDTDVVHQFRSRATDYLAAVETHGWDGNWYRRAFFDDGTPLGSASSDECRIDAIAQSWSVISKAGAIVRQEQAMRSLDRQLVREDARLIMLLTPPFDKGAHDPGYIKGYLPGVRENGAQYTHGALWAVLATAMQGDGDRAFALYQMINPFTHGGTAKDIEVYKVEPYVVAADVYTAKGQVGRGGWTWYTGSASWMYRVGLESILGFTKTGNTLRMNPCVPGSWSEYAITYRFGNATYEITVHDPVMVRHRGPVATVDGVLSSLGNIELIDDGKTHVVVVRPVG
ncbi:MAG: glucoamylase family protein [Gemmatimonadaceae bacterium]